MTTAPSNNPSGGLVVLSGPSGVGKSTIIKQLLEDPRYGLSVSATTRAPRPGEKDGVDYWFITREEFERRIRAGEFLEYAVVHGQNMYGTLRSEVERLTALGRVVLLDIDVQGARLVRKTGLGVYVFIMPPSIDELMRRLDGRHTETADVIARRLETAKAEIAAKNEYDHVVVNDRLETSVAEIRAIVESFLSKK